MTDTPRVTNGGMLPMTRRQPQTSLLYQLRVRSDFESWGSEVNDVECDVEFVRADDQVKRPFILSDSTCMYNNDAAGVMLHGQDDWRCLRYAEAGDFFFRDPRSVVCYVNHAVSETLVASLLQGPVAAVLLELRGVACLHASAVQVGDRAVAFVGHSGSGKSTIAARLVADGYPLVTDDILPIAVTKGQCIASPGYPQMKLHPAMAEQFAACGVEHPALGKHLQAVGQGWGRFAKHPLPLTAVYRLERSNACHGPATIEPLHPRVRFVELVRFSFCARVVRCLGLDAVRFHELGQLANQVSVYGLRYPNGICNLQAACQTLLAHAERIQS